MDFRRYDGVSAVAPGEIFAAGEDVLKVACGAVDLPVNFDFTAVWVSDEGFGYGFGHGAQR